MKIFTSAARLEQVRNEPIYDTVKELLGPIICPYSNRPYRPEEDGFLVVVEKGDVDRVLDDLQLPYRLAEVPFEGVTFEEGVFHAVYVPNNEFALSLLVPDADWLPSEVREHLEEHLDS